MAATLRKTLRYSLLPGIVPRIREFVTSLLTQIALFMAQAYGAVQLLPPTHPYLIPANAGRFGIRNVMGAARRNLVFRRQNIDQIILYYTVAGGLFLIMTQFVMLAASFSIHAAFADTGSYWGAFFVTPHPQGDLAFLVLDHVFGLLNSAGNGSFFGSCAYANFDAGFTGTNCPTVDAGTGVALPPFSAEGLTDFPSPFHIGLQAMFNFYNLGVASVGILILLYLVVTTVGETAQSGVAFGERFNRSWAIPRMMLAAALLTPLTSGMNGAQWATLYVAKWGSSMATNGWIAFNKKVAATTPLGNPDDLVPQPNAPGYNTLPRFMMVARTCKQAETLINRANGGVAPDIEAYQVHGADYWPWPASFADALKNSGYQDIVIVFGEHNAEFKEDAANVKPVCGSITMSIKDVVSPGPLAVQTDYYKMIDKMWKDDSDYNTCCGGGDSYERHFVQRMTPVASQDPDATIPDRDYIDGLRDWFEAQTAQAFTDGRTATAKDPRWKQSYTDLGWAGSSIWYNRIAAYNGSFVSALDDAPKPGRYPEVMEYLAGQHGLKEKATVPSSYYCLATTDDGKTLHTQYPSREDPIDMALCYAQSFWPAQEQKSTGSPVLDYIKELFGVSGLFNMRNNINVNPLAQVVGVGRSMIDAFRTAMGAAVTSSLVGLVDPGTIKTLANMTGKISLIVASLALAIGFILYYIIPFMPFVYVFFALGGWVKAIFEAMVGLPLWALAHLRIDGEGIPGPVAMNGYYLILEIFIRPMMIVFGLIGGISLFTAEVQVLNQIWELVISNVGGFDIAKNAGVTSTEIFGTTFLTDILDSFAYTVLYAFVVYMLALSSFKLIDQVPRTIMRWIGQARLHTFGNREDAGAQFLGGATRGVQNVQGVFGQGVYGLLFGKK